MMELWTGPRISSIYPNADPIHADAAERPRGRRGNAGAAEAI